MKTTLLIFLGSCICGCILPSGNAQTSPTKSYITLNGQSSGGTLTLMKAPGENYPFVVVTNQIGERASVVISRLASALQNCSSCAKWFGGLNPVVELSSNTIVLLGGSGAKVRNSTWILAGTDKGFRLPEPPDSLTARFNSGKVKLAWENPAGGFDSIVILRGGVPIATLSGQESDYMDDPSGTGRRALFPEDDLIYMLVGYKDGSPSNGSGVRLRNRNRLETLMNIPFRSGLAPGFRAWTDTQKRSMVFEQRNLDEMRPNADIGRFEGNGFYQVIKAKGNGTGVVSRRFIGLTPGKTYRVGAKVNTFDTEQGNWSFSMHALHGLVSTEEMAKARAVRIQESPNLTNKGTLSQVIRFNSAATTHGKWLISSSGGLAEDNQAGDVTLPAGVDSITVWFRFETAHQDEGFVGIEHVTIEELP